jgi:hypothetical protein
MYTPSVLKSRHEFGKKHIRQEEPMDLNVILQVAIGMIFVWIILAVITSQVQEWIASILAWRAHMLEDAIENMLADPGLKDKLYDHPLIKGLYSNKGKRKPGGIPPDKFALVLFEEIMNSGVTVEDVKSTFDKLKKKVEALKDMQGNNELKKFAATVNTLLIGVEEKAGDAAQAVTEARKRVEGWFNDSMDRLGGAYRRRAQIAALVVGLSVAAALNVDTVAIVNTLWKDPFVRQALVVQAGQLQAPQAQPDEQPAPPPSVDEILKNAEQLQLLSLPIGWTPENIPSDANGWATKFVGILLSGMAGAQGAPFWFDLMRKLLSRNPPPEAKSSG